MQSSYCPLRSSDVSSIFSSWAHACCWSSFSARRMRRASEQLASMRAISLNCKSCVCACVTNTLLVLASGTSDPGTECVPDRATSPQLDCCYAWRADDARRPGVREWFAVLRQFWPYSKRHRSCCCLSSSLVVNWSAVRRCVARLKTGQNAVAHGLAKHDIV
jgi:hypothetical protein